MLRRLGFVLLAAACGGNNNNNKTPDAPEIMFDGPTPTMTVMGTGTGHFVTDTGVTDVPQPFDQETITSITAQTQGSGFDHRDGAGSGDGTFTAPVTQGASDWYIGLQFQANPPAFIFGHDNPQDVSFSNFGRVPAFASAVTNVTMSLTGLEAWGAIDDLEIMDSNAGAMIFSPQTSCSPSSPRRTTRRSPVTQFAWIRDQDRPLPDSSMGDTTFVFQLSTAKSGTDTYNAISRLGSVASFTVTSGQTATLTAALIPVAQNETLEVQWKRSQFDAFKAASGPGAIEDATQQLIAIDALPDANNRGFYGNSPDLVEFVDPPAGATDLDDTFTYGNPFVPQTGGSTWDEFVLARYNFKVPLKAPGASSTTTLEGGCEVDAKVSDVKTTPAVTPLVSPVTGVMVNGMDAFTAQTGVTATPTLSWTAPTTGTVFQYNVVIFALTKNGGASVTTQIASFQTTGTSFQIPDTLLMSNIAYVAQISGTTQQKLPQSFCTVITNSFTP